jgi:hypothetical protein
MKLPPGATGFDATPGTGFALSAFTAICHHAARTVGGTAAVPAGATPSFHTVEITRHGVCTAVLGHNSVSIIAFAEPRPPDDATVTFIDRPELAAAIRATCDLPIFTKQQLNAPISTADLTALGSNEHRQIRHWRPNTIGELLFNFWD